MGEDTERKKAEPSKGFSGLSAMVSEVDATVTNVQNGSKGPAETPTKPGHGGTLPQSPALDKPQPHFEGHREPYPESSSSTGSPAGKWLFVMAGVIGLIWLLSQSENQSSVSTPTYAPSPQSSGTVFPTPSWGAAPTGLEPQMPSRPSEEKPPVGTELVLSVPQIRYCVAEDIRLDAAKAAVSGYAETDVNRFNEMVADYNSRCGNFRHTRGALELARAELVPYRSELDMEGRGRFIAAANNAPRMPLVRHEEESHDAASISTQSTPPASVFDQEPRVGPGLPQHLQKDRAVKAQDTTGAVREKYAQMIRDHVSQHIFEPPSLPDDSQVAFDVVLLPGGEVFSVALSRSSGLPAYDAAVERAIRKASPLPLPSDPALFDEFRELRLVIRRNR